MKISKVSILLLLGAGYLAYRTISNAKDEMVQIFDNMSYKLLKISRLDVSTKRIQIVADIGLQNNTNFGANVKSGGYARLNQIMVTEQNGDIVSTINLNIDHFKIDPNSITAIKNVIIEIPFLKALSIFGHANLSNFSAQSLLADLDFYLITSILGKTQTIKLEK